MLRSWRELDGAAVAHHRNRAGGAQRRELVVVGIEVEECALLALRSSLLPYCSKMLLSVPMPSIVTSMVLTFSFIEPTPTEVPQAMTSPG